MGVPDSSSSVLNADSPSAASGHSTLITPTLAQPATTRAAIEQRELLPAYLRDSRQGNSFTEYDKLVDQLEAHIGTRVEAMARERKQFYAEQKRVFESQHDQLLQSERHSHHFSLEIQLIQKLICFLVLSLKKVSLQQKMV